MAKEQYNVADRNFGTDDGEARTAGDRVGETVQETPDAEAAQFAADAGVSHAAYVNYATALDAHAAREDIEGLDERRRREYGNAFGDADFMRRSAYNAEGGVADAPRPGTVYGHAPDATGDALDTDDNTGTAPDGYGVPPVEEDDETGSGEG